MTSLSPFAARRAYSLAARPARCSRNSDVLPTSGESINATQASRSLADLGIAPTSAEIILPTYLDRYRPGGRFNQPLAA